ncbi:hypothetical protein BJF86_14545 [Serinicoccus sp. CNJ-927]|uniref:hypothetical protein n=1 Tax=Serinicoccus sp. CNJ-927 TaxID=1904970 RepID=UPI000969AE4D|nr:hypothetical protein [Serinicoccus sp. CNJ-927]OLT42609.1 hypothetical protein BJF86_14545 [Serinicoccus sp. CNJ-927]
MGNFVVSFFPLFMLGAFTGTMTALPGTSAIQNAIPNPYLGTDGFAAPGWARSPGSSCSPAAWAG